MRVLWLLTARAGSKGVPGKNLRRIGGVSLIARKIRGALPAMGASDRLICSTECPEIAAEAERHGAAWLRRPDELATDTATSSDVVWHAMKNVEGAFDAVMLLEPSAPFSKPAHYLEALAKLDAGADAAIGMRLVEPHSDFVDTMNNSGCIARLAERVAKMQRSRRQDFAPEWTASGGLYLATWEMLAKTRSYYGSYKTYGILQDRYSGHEIDSLEDLTFAEFIVERGYV